jgi:DsbC/DsbD-like thiol-disulfide interchange protein
MTDGRNHDRSRRWATQVARPALFLAIAALLMCVAPLGWPQTAPPSHARLALIADPSSQRLTTTWVGVLFHLDQGWHVYWENAGDSGTPPKIEWHLPAGYKAGAIQWPTPKRLGSGSVIDYGYENQVLLMASISRAPGSGVSTKSDSISADVKYVVCREVCIPGKAHLILAAAGASAHPPADGTQSQAIFAQTRAQLPKPAPASWKVSATQDKDHFVLHVRGAGGTKGASFLPLDAGEIENSAGQIFLRVSGTDRFTLGVKKSDQLVKPISELRGLVEVAPGRAYEIAAPVTH